MILDVQDDESQPPQNNINHSTAASQSHATAPETVTVQNTTFFLHLRYAFGDNRDTIARRVQFVRELIESRGGAICDSEEYQLSPSVFHVVDTLFPQENPSLWSALCRTNGVAVIGVQCLLDSIAMNVPLPLCLPHAIFSRALEGVNVLCVNMPDAVKDAAENLVRRMNGTCTTYLDQSTTLVLTCSVGSHTYLDATQHSIPVVHPSFMTSCWAIHPKLWNEWDGVDVATLTSCSRNHISLSGKPLSSSSSSSTSISSTSSSFSDDMEIDASSSSSSAPPRSFLADATNHVLPPFSGCLVCVTGLSLSTRNTVRQLVTDSGGHYTSDLTRDCTHLVAASARGLKFHYARRWNVQVVTMSWLLRCVNSNTYLPADRDGDIIRGAGHGRGGDGGDGGGLGSSLSASASSTPVTASSSSFQMMMASSPTSVGSFGSGSDGGTHLYSFGSAGASGGGGGGGNSAGDNGSVDAGDVTSYQIPSRPLPPSSSRPSGGSNIRMGRERSFSTSATSASSISSSLSSTISSAIRKQHNLLPQHQHQHQHTHTTHQNHRRPRSVSFADSPSHGRPARRRLTTSGLHRTGGILKHSCGGVNNTNSSSRAGSPTSSSAATTTATTTTTLSPTHITAMRSPVITISSSASPSSSPTTPALSSLCTSLPVHIETRIAAAAPSSHSSVSSTSSSSESSSPFHDHHLAASSSYPEELRSSLFDQDHDDNLRLQQNQQQQQQREQVVPQAYSADQYSTGIWGY